MDYLLHFLKAPLGTYRKDVGYTSTVAAFTIFGPMQESIRTMNDIFCNKAVVVYMHNIPHMPGPTKEMTISRKENCLKSNIVLCQN